MTAHDTTPSAPQHTSDPVSPTASADRPFARVRRWLGRELPSRRKPFVAAPLAAGLAAVGALHVAWGFGTLWPYATEEEFARHLLGQGDTAPPAFASHGVGVGLLAGSYLALAVGGLVPRIGPRWTYRLGAVGLTAVLLGRGLLGPLTHSGAAAEYIRLDWRLYSPLCLVLGVLALTLATGLGRPDAEREPAPETN